MGPGQNARCRQPDPRRYQPPLGLVDLTSGRTTQLPGDGVSEVVWATWTRNGQILALEQGMDATIWTFTRKSQ